MRPKKHLLTLKNKITCSNACIFSDIKFSCHLLSLTFGVSTNFVDPSRFKIWLNLKSNCNLSCLARQHQFFVTYNHFLASPNLLGERTKFWTPKTRPIVVPKCCLQFPYLHWPLKQLLRFRAALDWQNLRLCSSVFWFSLPPREDRERKLYRKYQDWSKIIRIILK